MMVDLHNKVALITGAAERAGKNIALTLAKAGVDIAITHLHTFDAAKETKAEIEALGRRCLCADADIANIKQMTDFVDVIEAEFGRLDFLIHNACNYNRQTLFDVKEEHWDSSHDIIVKGPFFLSQYAAKLMLKNNFGRIIALVGNSYYEVWPKCLPHLVAKSALVKMMECLAIALSPDIQCNSICPSQFLLTGDADHDINYKKQLGQTISEDGKYHIVQNSKLYRGNPDDVSELVLFLCSCSNYINGAVIPIDAGKRLL